MIPNITFGLVPWGALAGAPRVLVELPTTLAPAQASECARSVLSGIQEFEDQPNIVWLDVRTPEDTNAVDQSYMVRGMAAIFRGSSLQVVLEAEATYHLLAEGVHRVVHVSPQHPEIWLPGAEAWLDGDDPALTTLGPWVKPSMYWPRRFITVTTAVRLKAVMAIVRDDITAHGWSVAVPPRLSINYPWPAQEEIE